MTRFTPNLLILALGGAALALAGCSGGKQTEPSAEQSAADEPTATSTDWTVQNPTDPAVPVNLPKTVMTNAPPEPAKPAASPAAPDK